VSVRVYVPVTSGLLAVLRDEGRLSGPLRAHAVTDELRSAWPEADEESLEYAATMAAAATSAALRAGDDRPRRFVVAADVPDVAPVAGDDPTLVDVAADVVLKRVAAILADPEDRPDLEADEDDELAWFATQELPYLG
jgi:hypothetical protein